MKLTPFLAMLFTLGLRIRAFLFSYFGLFGTVVFLHFSNSAFPPGGEGLGGELREYLESCKRLSTAVRVCALGISLRVRFKTPSLGSAR